MVFPQKSWGEPNIFSTLYGLCILVGWPTLCAASKGADLGMRGVLSVLCFDVASKEPTSPIYTRQYSALLFFSVCKTILWWGAISHISTRCYVFQQKTRCCPHQTIPGILGILFEFWPEIVQSPLWQMQHNAIRQTMQERPVIEETNLQILLFQPSFYYCAVHGLICYE